MHLLPLSGRSDQKRMTAVEYMVLLSGVSLLDGQDRHSDCQNQVHFKHSLGTSCHRTQHSLPFQLDFRIVPEAKVRLESVHLQLITGMARS